MCFVGNFRCLSVSLRFFFFPFYTFTLSLGSNKAKDQCLIQTMLEGQEIKQGYICSQKSLRLLLAKLCVCVDEEQ